MAQSTISVSDANALLGNAVFIDVRFPKDYEAGHIPGAHNMNEIFTHLTMGSEEAIAEFKATFTELFSKVGVSSDSHVIVYEESMAGLFGASCRGWYMLQTFGHANVSVLHGGLQGWRAAGLPVSTEAAAQNAGDFSAGWNADIWASKEEVSAAISGTDPAYLLDVRDIDEWTGESSSPYGKDFAPRKGRFEGANYILWKDFTKTEENVEMIKSSEEVTGLMSNGGIQKDKPVIVYCFKGARASLAYLAIKEAGYNAKLYFPSWNEWSRDSSLPIDDSVKAKTHLQLQSGDKIPTLGLGLWKLPKDKCADAVVAAVEAGYRLFDSAADYGNEQQTGEGLRRAIDQGLVKREELFIVSKLWNTFHQPQHVKLACQKSLSDLGLDYLDLYLIHFPIPLKFVPIETRYPPEWIHDPSAETPKLEPDDTGVTYQQTYQAMEELVAEGLVRNIGCSNIGCMMLRQVLQYAKVMPAVLQVEIHPFNTCERLIRFANQLKVEMMGYSNLGHASYTELGMATSEDSCLDLPLIADMAAKYSKTPAQVILRWGVQRGTVCIPKTSSKERLAENIDLFSFSLTEDEMKSITALNKNKRFNDPGSYAEPAFGHFYPIYE